VVAHLRLSPATSTWCCLGFQTIKTSLIQRTAREMPQSGCQNVPAISTACCGVRVYIEFRDLWGAVNRCSAITDPQLRRLASRAATANLSGVIIRFQ
jgi:hypothetical protein